MSIAYNTSSDAAAAIYVNPEFQGEVDDIMKGAISLEQLVVKADKIIKEFATHKKSSKNIDGKVIQLDRVIVAMLAHARQAGGDGGQRYVASRVVACQNDPEKLGAVGYTWLTHLLFIFKSANVTPSPPATPIIDETGFYVDQDATDSLRNQLVLRDGYQCVVTGFYDRAHPSPPATTKFAHLKGTHILRSAVAFNDADLSPRSSTAAIVTLDILRNFTGLTEKEIKQISSVVDDPSNGILLEINARDEFDNFQWCLHETAVTHQYKIRQFNDRSPLIFLCDDINAPVIFKDQSRDFAHTQPSANSPSISLPNPHFIAIHAAIAGTLHMSGAGKFLDELLDKYQDYGHSNHLLYWTDLETLMDAEIART